MFKIMSMIKSIEIKASFYKMIITPKCLTYKLNFYIFVLTFEYLLRMEWPKHKQYFPVPSLLPFVIDDSFEGIC